LLVLDKDLRVLAANCSFYRLFKVKAGETVGNLIYDLGNRQWDIPALPQKAVFNDYEVDHGFPTIGRRILLLNARHIPALPKEAQRILLAFEDVTQRIILKRILQDSEERFRTAF
jgi:PAS domain-containing protein